MFSCNFLSLCYYCLLIQVLIFCIYCRSVWRPRLVCINVLGRMWLLAIALSFPQFLWPSYGLGGWRCRLNLSMFLLTISVGRIRSVLSDFKLSAIKKNLRNMSDIQRVFWTVLLRMTSRVFLFFTPSDSNLERNWFVCKEPRTPVVKLVWDTFQPLFSRWLRWFIKPRREMCLSFFPAPSSRPSPHSCQWLWCIPRIHLIFFPRQRQAVRPSGYKRVNVCIVKVDGIGDVVFFNVFPQSDPVLARSWRGDHMKPHIFQDLV